MHLTQVYKWGKGIAMATQHVTLDYERLENHCNIFSIPSCGTERLQPDPRLSPGNEVEGSEVLRNRTVIRRNKPSIPKQDNGGYIICGIYIVVGGDLSNRFGTVICGANSILPPGFS